MYLNIKIEAKGFCYGLNKYCESTLYFNMEPFEFEKLIGEALYQVERQGYGFKTNEVYSDVVTNYRLRGSFRNNYCKIYSSDVLNIWIKSL